MSLVSDYVVVGSGLTALLVAKQIHKTEQSVTIISPDSDFLNNEGIFSYYTAPPEFDFDQSFELMNSYFPGAMRRYKLNQTATEIPSDDAPIFRERNLIDINSKNGSLTDLFLWSKVPGANIQHRRSNSWYANSLKHYDIELKKFHFGVFDFIYERLGSSSFFTQVNSIKIKKKQVQFHYKGQIENCRAIKGVIVCLDPKLSNVLFDSFDQRIEFQIVEELELNSRESILAESAARYDSMTFFSNATDPSQSRDLKVYNVFEPTNPSFVIQADLMCLTEKTLNKLSELCNEILGWEKFSITKHSFQWFFKNTPELKEIDPNKVWLISGSGLPLHEVLNRIDYLENQLWGVS